MGLLRYRRVELSIARSKATRILEVGVHRAERSTRFIAAALRGSGKCQYWGFDLFAELATSDKLRAEAMPGGHPLSRADVEALLSGPGVELQLVAGDTRETLPQSVPTIGLVDVVFLDGGHSYETVRSDWRAVQQLLHPGSVVFLDDYIVGPAADALGCGVARLVDEIDRSQYDVRLLHPIDTALMKAPPGLFRTRIARVTRKGSTDPDR
jgi:hypothetical protein